MLLTTEEQTGGAILRPPAQPQFSGSCSAASPPSCATFDLDDLHWGLHDKHTYVAKVRVTNVVGLDLQLTSEPYVHDTRLAAAGSVYERVPSWEEDVLGIRVSSCVLRQFMCMTSVHVYDVSSCV